MKSRPRLKRTLIISTLLLATVCLAQAPSAKIPRDDTVRVREFYRLSSQIQDKLWPHWSETPAPLLLVTTDSEFLTHRPSPPKDFTKITDDFYARPRQFPVNLLATFPAFGPPSVIVVGEPANTTSKTSTPWLITLMHEHFHQLQDSQPGLDEAITKLGISHGDTTGMWMLNYPFPYEKQEVAASFGQLRDVLVATIAENDKGKFATLAVQYLNQRKHFLAQLSADDHKYFEFQLWKEGIARYTQVKAAEAAAQYQPSAEYTALPDFESFADYAAKARSETLTELKPADLAKLKRLAVYSFGAGEGLLLDRLKPDWKDEYFKHPLTMDFFFEN